MRKRARISWLLCLSLFVLQATGLHLHAHASSDASQLATGVVVHVALATDHAGGGQQHHDEDLQVGLPDSGILKKADSGDELFAVLPRAIPHVLSVILHDGLVLADLRAAFPAVAVFLRPHPRAPPLRNHI